MNDLRLFANELIGKKFTIVREDRRAGTKRIKYTITEVYPYHVAAYCTCENGVSFREAFTIGDLVQMGILQSRKKAHYMVGEREGTRWERSEQNG